MKAGGAAAASRAERLRLIPAAAGERNRRSARLMAAFVPP
jgi:hypothetical protein